MVQIGDSQLDVYPLCLGTNPFGWTADSSTAHKILDTYVAAGGNFLDTADVYPAWAQGAQGGDSERILGDWLRNRKRDELVVATKVGKLEGLTGLAPQVVKRAAEESLTRLQTDHVDLFYAHAFDPDTPVEESVAAFAALQQEGKIRQVGLSNFTAAQIGQWVEETRRQGVEAPVALQPNYNLLYRQDYEVGLQPAVEEYGLGVMPYFALAAGLLTGKYRSEEQVRGMRADHVRRYLSDTSFAVVDALVEVASMHNVEPASVAVAWLLANPTVTAPVASASSPDQVGPLLEGVGLVLSDEELGMLEGNAKG